MGFSIERTTGQKCLVPGIYNPMHNLGENVDLRIFKRETFPTYGGDAETVWVQTYPLFSESQIEHAQSLLREYYLRYFGAKPN